MNKRKFYTECLKLAWRDKFLRAEAITGILALLSGPIALYWHPEDKLMWTLIPPIVFGLAFIAIFFFGLITSPYEIHTKDCDRIEKLEKRIEDKDNRQRAIDNLWQFRSTGISLRNEFPKTPEEYNEWQPKFWEWRNELLPEVEKVSPNLRQWLERLDVMRPEAVRISPFKLVQIISEILARLGEYLEGEIYNIQRNIPKS